MTIANTNYPDIAQAPEPTFVRQNYPALRERETLYEELDRDDLTYQGRFVWRNGELELLGIAVFHDGRRVPGDVSEDVEIELRRKVKERA